MEGLRPGWTVKVLIVIIFTSILFRCVSATNHSVGGPSGWDFSSNLQAWSASTTFYAGDVLVFSYGPIHDVLEVDRLDYSKCRTVKPISAHNDGDTVVPLTEAGTRYFICGRRGHCAMGLRLQLQVLPPPANNSTAPAGSSSSNSSSSSNGGSSGRKSGGRGNKQHPPPSPSNSPPPPGPNAEKEPSPPDTPPNDQAETPAPPSSGVGRMMTGGLLYWWLLFATMVISVTPLVTTSVTAFLSFN